MYGNWRKEETGGCRSPLSSDRATLTLCLVRDNCITLGKFLEKNNDDDACHLARLL